MNFSSLKNIVFDLGGVIINIDFNLTFNAFAQLTGADIPSLVANFKEKKIFYRYEIGQFSDQEFRDFLRQELKTALSDQQIDEAWNKLLLDIPNERIKLIGALAEKYNLFLLSNTNSIHIKEVNNILHRSTGINSLNELFKKVYLSYEMQMSKPSVAIYELVLKENGLKKEETLFIDDSLENIKGAALAGIHTLHVSHPNNIIDLLKNA